MPTATHLATRLAYDSEGAGDPVVLLHGLTFNRRTWKPIVDKLGHSIRSIAIDLPAHGESGGAPAPLAEVAGRVHELLASLDVERPVVVGHSMSGGLAFMYAAAYPARGVVVVDQGLDVRPVAETLHRIEPALRGPAFASAFQPFEDSLGLERIPEPLQSFVRDNHTVTQEVVVGYWDHFMRADPAKFQAWIDAQVLGLDVPCLAVLGRPLSDGDRERFGRMADVQLEDAQATATSSIWSTPAISPTRLRQFVEYCTAGDWTLQAGP